MLFACFGSYISRKRAHISVCSTMFAISIGTKPKSWQSQRRDSGNIYWSVHAEGTGRPNIEYSSSARATTTRSNIQSFDKIQNQALRIITGGMKSTSINYMEEILWYKHYRRRNTNTKFFLAQECNYLSDHPIKNKLQCYTKNRLKRSSLSMKSRNWDKNTMHLP